MLSLGPFPLSLAVWLLAFALAALVARLSAKPTSDPAEVKPLSTLLDMALVGIVAARLGFVLAWWPEYLAEPSSILRLGDGGFSLWIGVPAGLAVGAWRARRLPALRRPLLYGVASGLAAWALLGGGLLVMQRSAVTLPVAELERLEGGRARLSTLRGQPMVVNLWATWCPPCRREMPVLARAQADRRDVTFVFVNQGESVAEIRDYLRETRLPLEHVFIDPLSTVSQETGTRGLPTTLFFAADGRLVATHVGELTDAGLAARLQQFGATRSR